MDEKKDNEIMYSKAIKAGKRIYYLDVKKSRNDDMFLAITESKKKVTGNGSDQEVQVTYEKHKIFLYKEDFSKFMEGMDEVISFIRKEQGDALPRETAAANNNQEKTDSVNPVLDGDESASDTPKSKGFFNKFKF